MVDTTHPAETQILVVEDEVILAMKTQMELEDWGYGVAVVASGEAAVQKAEEMRPNLVLMDIRLRGEMDGIEAAKQICARFDIPVIYMTGLADEATMERARVTEPLGFLCKPVGAEELRSTVEMALHRHKLEADDD